MSKSCVFSSILPRCKADLFKEGLNYSNVLQTYLKVIFFRKYDLFLTSPKKCQGGRCHRICQDFFTFIQIGSGHTVRGQNDVYVMCLKGLFLSKSHAAKQDKRGKE